MSTTPLAPVYRYRLNAVLHPTDFTDEALVAFHHALMLATAAKARLDLLHAEPDNTEISLTTFPHVGETMSRWKLVGPHPDEVALRGAGVRARRMVAPGREPADAILAEVVDARSDLLVLATHGRTGVARLLQPSVTEAVTRLAGIPTLVIPPGVSGFVDPRDGLVTLRRILVPVAHTPSPDLALHLAMTLGSLLALENVTLSTLYMGGDGDAPKLDVALPATWTHHPWTHPSGVVPGIVETARDWSADLIVMTSSGHDSMLDDLRGSTAERVLRGAPCPVLVVPGTLPS